MNKAIKNIVTIVEEHNGLFELEEPIRVVYDVSVTYRDDVVVEHIDGLLKSVSFSMCGDEKLLTFQYETERGDIYIDYSLKYNYTTMYYHFATKECNETLGKNTPIKVLRQILKAIS